MAFAGCSPSSPAPAAAPVTAESESVKNYPAYGNVKKMDDRLDALIAPGQRMELLGSGYDWSEGLVWVDEYDFLLFSDIPKNKVHKWSEAEGVTDYLEPSGFTGAYSSSKEPGSNRLVIDPAGKLLLCQHGDRRIARMEAPLDAPEAKFTTVVAEYEGKRLNSPNDAIYHQNGDLYFTDPPYGLPGVGESSSKELDFQGVYRLPADGGPLQLLTKELDRPNGLAFTPDHQHLIVGNSDRANWNWTKYPVKPDGSLGAGKVIWEQQTWADEGVGGPDGMRMHSSGHLFATGPGGVLVFHPDETLLGIIKTGQKTGNVTFDGEEEYLYINADSLLLRIELLPLTK
ncbi:hypothetical protein A3850_018870 [Lewinella sp. 4G2]|nr:hypothetical protein A3850_018870 [Lewinella sp. 4G2]